MAGLTIDLGLDEKTILKLRAIAKHAEALANELDAIDAAQCLTCGGLLEITEISIGDKVVDTSAYCGNCRD